MQKKPMPFAMGFIEKLIEQYPTPFHIYDERGIRDNMRHFAKAFSWVEGFKEYFAVKACPNPHILRTLHEEGCGTDCSSLAELVQSEKSGILGEDIMFSSNVTPARGVHQSPRVGGHC